MKTVKSTNSAKAASRMRPLNEARLQDFIDGAPAGYRIDQQKPYADQQADVVKSAFAGADPLAALQAMRFSRGWQPQLDLFSLELDVLPGDVPVLDRRIHESENGAFEVLKAGGNTYELSMKFPQKAQGFLMAALKPHFPKLAVKFANGFLTGTFSDERTAANVFLAAAKIINGWNPKKNGRYVDIVDGPENFVPGLATEYAAAVKTVKGDDTSRVRVKGPFKYVKHVCNYRDQYEKQMYAGLKLESNSTAVTYDMAWLVREFGKALGKAEELRRMKFGLIFRTFLSDLEKKAQDDPNIKVKDAACAAKLFSVDAKGLLDHYRKEFDELAQKEEKIVPTMPAAVRRMKLFEDAKWYGAQIIDDVNGWIAAVCREHEQAHCFGRLKPKVDKNGKIIPDANLRDDEIAAKYPGDKAKQKELMTLRDNKNASWVKDGLGFDGSSSESGWCVGGNGGDWTREWKSDGGKGNWSHVNTYFKCKKRNERMPFIVYMEISSGRLYCSNMQYENPCNGYYLPDGSGWCQYDFNTEANGYNDGGIEKKLSTDRGFREVYTKANIAAFGEYTAEDAPGAKTRHWNAISEPPDFNNMITAKYTGKAGPMEMKTTDNGVVLVESRDEFRKVKDNIVKPYVTAVKLAFKDGSHLFEGMNISNLRTIDCSDVENARSMFEQAFFGHQDRQFTDLVSTAKCRDMSSMFKGVSGLGKILNLDTRSAESIMQMFYMAETTNQRKLVLPTLDLGKCTNIAGAFRMSPVSELNLKNIQNVSDATGAITDCWMLEKCTPLLFKSRSVGTFGLTKQEVDGNPELAMAGVFSGCDKLQRRPDFQQTLDDMVKYYVLDPEHLDVDDDGSAVLYSHDDAETYSRHPERYGYNVTIYAEDASGMFSELTVAVNRLKLVGVRSAARMFMDCDIKRLSTIDVSRSPDLEHVDFMFAGTNIFETPSVDFSSAKTALGIFASCNSIRSFGMEDQEKTPYGNTTFGQLEVDFNVITDKQFDPAKYLFSGDAVHGGMPEGAIRRMDLGRVQKYAEQFFKDAAKVGAASWVRAHVARAENGKTQLRIDLAGDLKTYGDILEKYPDILEGSAPEEVAVPNWVDADEIFKNRKIDFLGLGLSFEQVRPGQKLDVSDMFMDSSVSNLPYVRFGKNRAGGVTAVAMFDDSEVLDAGHGDLAIDVCPENAKRMFAGASFHVGLAIEDCSKAVNCANMFQEFGLAEGQKLSLGVFSSHEFLGEGMFLDASVGPISVNSLFAKDVVMRSSDAMFAGQTITDDELTIRSGVATEMFRGCKFPKDVKSITVDSPSAPGAFKNASGVENIDSLVISRQASGVPGMFEDSSVKVVCRMDIAPNCNAGSMFKGSKLEVIADVSEGFTSSQSMNIFSQAPAAESYGYDGEYLKLYLKGLQKG